MESDPEAANILFQITILVILTLINAFFAGSEMAVVSVNKNKIHRLSEQGNKNAALIERLMKDSTVFLSTIQVAITLAGFFSSASAATGIAQVLAVRMAQWNLPYSQTRCLVSWCPSGLPCRKRRPSACSAYVPFIIYHVS